MDVITFSVLLALLSFLLGLFTKEILGMDIIGITSILIIFIGTIFFCLQILSNFYLNSNIYFMNNFSDYLSKQFGSFVIGLFFSAIYKKNFA